MDIALDLKGISKRYPGVMALDGVSLSVRAGEVHAVLGENGSGKSTLLGIASGAIAPSAGEVSILGRRLMRADPLEARRLGLATVYQDDSLVRELSVAANLILGATHRRLPMAEARREAERQLELYGLALDPGALVSSLSPAQRQFLEIVKALSAEPRVLLLDEPTSTLDLAGVTRLAALVRQVTAAGVAVVYVSHRLPEILELADRVTILRDGIGQGTYAVTPELSESALVDLMVGHSVAAGYPDKRSAGKGDEPLLRAEQLSGAHFADISFSLGAGEILGFAGAEGNGQREVLRALAGFAPATGQLTSAGRPLPLGEPAALNRAGLAMLSADRAEESIFAPLGLRENMTIKALPALAGAGLVSGSRERQAAQAMVDELGIVTATLDKPISGLSGGNQQKGVLARSLLAGPRVLLVDEPTQGVDANARFDLYRALRDKARQGMGIIVKSSDAMELAGICDRVLVFSRGRIVGELAGDAVSEENIVSAFLTARHDAAVGEAAGSGAAGGRAGRQWLLPLAFLALLIVLVGAFAAWRSDVFLTPLNLRHLLLAAAPLALVTMAQLCVLLVGGFDISVGSVMSLTVVLASFLVGAGAGPPQIALGIIACLMTGALVGGVNGVLVRKLGINPVITTIAMLSVLQGIALALRPTPGGAISEAFLGLLKSLVGFVPASMLALAVAAIAADFWLYRTRGGLMVRAVGFREQAARRNGVRVTLVHLRAYLLSGLLAAGAGLILASEVGVGHPNVGSTYTLTSIAAAVIGGASLAGGRGSFVGAVLGAVFFTLTVNIVPLLGVNTALGVIASGTLTLVAVLVYSGWRPGSAGLRLPKWARSTPVGALNASPGGQP